MDDDTRAALAARYAQVTADIDDLEGQRAVLRGMLAEEGRGTRQAGTLQVVVTVPRRLNEARFAERFPPVEFPALWQEKPRTAAVKGLGQDDLYDDGTTTVRVVDAR